MCHKCSDLQREIDALRAGNAVLRANNVKLAVENNNMRAAIGVQMRPVKAGYLVEWEQQREGGAA